MPRPRVTPLARPLPTATAEPDWGDAATWSASTTPSLAEASVAPTLTPAPTPTLAAAAAEEVEEPADAACPNVVVHKPGSIPPLAQLAPFESGRARCRSSVVSSSLTEFVSTGGRLPVLMVTAKREHVIRQSLSSLLACRGITADDVIVVQDGNHEPTARAAMRLGVSVHSKPSGGLRLDGASRIARHYGYALRYALETAAPTAPGVIVAEDDFVFSPDFYEYFHAVAPALEADSTVWLASAWNDNGNRHLLRHSAELRRTRYFPGLGWLLPRAVWEHELRSEWPTQHWDHWLRSPQRHRNRDVLHPEVPRDYHIGVKGTFMDSDTHNHYFRYVGMNADAAFSWFSERGEAAVAAALNPGWEQHLREQIASATLMRGVDDVSALRQGTALVVHASSPAGDNAEFRMIAPYFGIWHEPERASHAGVHILRWRGESTVLLVHRSSELLVEGARTDKLQLTVIPAREFGGRQRPDDVGRGAAAYQALAGAWEGGGGGLGPEGTPEQEAAAARLEPRPLRVVSPLEDEDVAMGLATGSVDLIPVIGEPRVRGVVARLLPWIEPRSRPPHAPLGAYTPIGQGRGGEEIGSGSLAGGEVTKTPGAGAAPAMPKTAPVSQLPEGAVVVAALERNRDCDAVCADEGNGRRCVSSLLPLINSCEWLAPFFGCTSGQTGCSESAGGDQPAFVVAEAPSDKLPGTCLINTNSQQFDCAGKWAFTRRLCPCA